MMKQQEQLRAKMDPPTAEQLEAHRQRRASQPKFDAKLHNTCSMSLVADQLYFNGPRGQSSVPTCTAAMVFTTMQASHIYETTDITGVGYGHQLSVEAITIYQAASDAGNPFGTATAVDSSSEDFLNILSAGDPLRGNNYNYACLAHAFTHQTFSDGIIGLAWIADTVQNYVAPASNVGAAGICGLASTACAACSAIAPSLDRSRAGMACS